MKKKRRINLIMPVLFGSVLFAFTLYVALDTFVIPRAYGPAVTASSGQAAGDNTSGRTGSGSAAFGNTIAGSAADTSTTGSDDSDSSGSDAEVSGESAQGSVSPADTASETETQNSTVSQSEPVITDTSYADGNVNIELTTYYEYDTVIYVADVQVTSAEYLKAAFAAGTYGRNITDTTSGIASDNDAILAVNGDFYGSQERGYVIRNGILYRSSARSGQEDLVIYSDGTFEIINEDDVSAEDLLANGAWQVFSFGPGIVSDGEIAVTEDEEVGKAKASNPRTAIGFIDDTHYVLVVSDGRTDESAGLSLYQLAEFMTALGVSEGYNLDGGGSSTMYFNGMVINNPTTSGNSIKERSVSDIIYF